MIVKPSNPQKLISLLREKPLILYGFGGAGNSIARWCSENQIDYIFADQHAVQKQKDTDKRIILPELLVKEYPNANIVVSSIVYYDEIVKHLLAMGVKEENILSYQLFLPERIRWSDLEHSTIWGTHMGRVKKIADWIPANAGTVADYGAGRLSLKEFLDPAISYYPIDYIKRSKETIICDFDRDNFPDIKTDVSVCTATLIFIEHAKELLEHICSHTFRTIILSYVTQEAFSNVAGRRASGYVNDFCEKDIQQMLLKYGFMLKEIKPDPANKIDTLYLFNNDTGGILHDYPA